MARWSNGTENFEPDNSCPIKNYEFEQIILHAYYEFDKYLFKIANK